ncbi:MurR/RpiR family transcriptional regulator [Enterococcus casseliflavus]|uniref:MurR/RpiR family transcriptional regulator n=1 Tax=Enterococcus casseliflavus TaxID=37734 RepID=UPI001E4EC3ED|nr:MurR/RpiR family transcriptional regulator [Enterococcus casseliflavus]MCD4962554.1 MurR/RpiR family transcriptional regulator [Enterococcus casseliflavus]
MNINNLGLLNSLSFILNEGIKDSDYAIAVYLVENINRASEVSINEIIDETFTSRSAVRRFCNRLGYSNFSDLKESITKMIFPSNLQYRSQVDLLNHRKVLNELIFQMIEDIDEMFSVNIVEEIIDLLFNHKDVILLCANNTSGDLIRFQQELIYGNKEIKIVSKAYTNNENIKSLSEESLIIVVSASGKFAEIANDWLNHLKGKKVLITAYRNQSFFEQYHHVFYISKNSFSSDYLGIYGKYGIVYIFDLIFSSYLSKYKKG